MRSAISDNVYASDRQSWREYLGELVSCAVNKNSGVAESRYELG